MENIKVYVRIRPFITSENGTASCLSINGSDVTLNNEIIDS